MLARLQRLLSLALLTSLGLTLWLLPEGQKAAGALAWLAIVVGGYALVLALEFLLMRWHNHDDPAPAASRLATLRAWWHELLYAPRVFGWRQPWRSQLIPDATRADTTRELSTAPDGRQRVQSSGHRSPMTAPPVLLVHGFVCNRGLWQPWLRTLRERGIVFVAVNLEPVFGSIDDYVPRIEAAVGLLESSGAGAPIVVAHSMGGLAVRAWWARPGNLSRLAQLITLGTPHQGTWLARFGFAANTRQMRSGSPWLEALAAAEQPDRALRRRRMTCYYSHCDNIVFPASRATLEGADNRHLPGVAHVQMADHPEPRAELLRRLTDGDRKDPDLQAGQPAAPSVAPEAASAPHRATPIRPG